MMTETSEDKKSSAGGRQRHPERTSKKPATRRKKTSDAAVSEAEDQNRGDAPSAQPHIASESSPPEDAVAQSIAEQAQALHDAAQQASEAALARNTADDEGAQESTGDVGEDRAQNAQSSGDDPFGINALNSQILASIEATNGAVMKSAEQVIGLPQNAMTSHASGMSSQAAATYFDSISKLGV